MTKRILILGGGFAGVGAAQELTKQLRRERRLATPENALPDGIEVLLVNRDNYFVFQPLLADILSGTIETTHVVVPLRRMLPHAQVEVGAVERIDTERKTVLLRRRTGTATEIDYDALVITVGGVTDLSAVPGMADHAVTVRTLGDAFYLRNRALDMLEDARIQSDAARREVLLVDRNNYFVFQPLLADIISGTIETTHVVVPLRRMLPHAQVEVGAVERIDTERKTVLLRRRTGTATEIDYDALVITLGGVTDLSAVPGMADHAVTVRTLGDAFYLRNRALDMLEDARIQSDADRREVLLTFVVVGGGSTGVEVAAELKDLLEVAARSFHDVRLEPRVVLVHSRNVVLSELGDRLGRYATRKLRGQGIDLRLGRRVRSVEADSVELDDGTTIPAATVVSTVGNAPNPVLADLPSGRDARGWLTPDATFAVPGLENVWALGDCASIADPRTGGLMPATAQHAIREGPHAARNVLAALDGRPQTPFDYGQLGMLVSLGRFKAVGDVYGIKVSGLLGWFLWRSYYLLRLPTFDRRLRVAIDWALDLILKHDIVEIGVRRTRAHPGEVPGEESGEPVSMGARPEAPDELVV